MKKLLVVILVISAVAGGILNAYTDRQVREGVPVTTTYLQCTSCLQTILMIIFSLIGGSLLLWDPKPIAKWLDKIRFRRSNMLAVRFLGFIMLATIPLSIHSIQTNCRAICLVILK